jgi:hypothetical protein
MSRRLLALSSLLLLAAGCRHTLAVPELPASHGYLTAALDRYVAKREDLPEEAVPGTFTLLNEESQVVVEPAEARRVFMEALAVLEGAPSTEEVRQAADDLKGACVAGLAEACAFLRERLERPHKLSGKPPDIPRDVILKQTFSVVVVHCWLGVNGKFRGCTALEGGPDGVTEAVLASIAEGTFQPAALAGHPIEVPYTMTATFFPARQGLTMEQRLQWARARAARFPQSSQAWLNLAGMLARHAPEDPWYADALHYINVLSPSSWWAASELAWLHVQAGRYAEAEPLVKRALTLEANNPYLLETSAAVLMATGQCEPALLQQRRAVAQLPPEWPAPERERFTRALEEYQRKCPKTDAAPVSEPAH